MELGNPDLGLLSQEMREGLPVTCSSPENRFYPFLVSHVVAGKQEQQPSEGNQIMWDVRYVEGRQARMECNCV